MRLSSYRRTLSTALLLALTTASGCGMAAVAFHNPTVELKGVQMRGIGLMDVLLDVYNPNYSDFEVRNVTYTVFADSIQVVKGEVTERVKLPGKKTTTVRLPLTFGVRELNKASGALSQRGSVEYTVEGEFSMATSLGWFRRTYRTSGRYDSL
ncbi:MAG: LEA type 2 family protein [Gemmatimonadetes bacterium]|nr:LEA type 2 family protein [Gemmatimonadota bacterium]